MFLGRIQGFVRREVGRWRRRARWLEDRKGRVCWVTMGWRRDIFFELWERAVTDYGKRNVV